MLLVQLQDKVSSIQLQMQTDNDNLQQEIVSEVDQVRTEQANLKSELLQQVQTEINVMREGVESMQTKMDGFHPNTEGKLHILVKLIGRSVFKAIRWIYAN